MNSVRKLKTTCIMLIALVCVCVAIIVCLLVMWPKSESGNNTSEPVIDTEVMEDKEITDQTQPAVSSVTDTDTVEMLEIETKYCILKYPAVWGDYLEVEENEENGVLTEIFYCCIDDKSVELFSVYFNAPETGNLIGYLTEGDNKVPCNVEFSDFVPEETWTEDEQNIYYGMGEGINEVMQSVMENEKYSEK